MGRPRYEKGDISAREKLEGAFWDALAEGPFEAISVSQLCRAARVNKNTFYYHFENLDQLACIATESVLDPAFVSAVIEGTAKGAIVSDFLANQELSRRLDRVCLLADDNASPRLRRMLRDAVVNAWESKLGIKADRLDLKGRASLEFVLGGFLGVLALRSREGDHFELTALQDAAHLSHAFAILDEIASEG